MKNILLDVNGDIFLEDNFSGSIEKIDTLKYYLDYQLKIDDGATFGQLFDHIMNDADTLDIIFGETMGGNSLEIFREEWLNEKINIKREDLGIENIRIRKTIEYFEVDSNQGFSDIRIDFDGVNDQTGVIYSLEFMSIPEMKNIPVVIDNTLHVENNTKSTDIEYPKSECVITLFDILGSILHEITFYGDPTQRDQTKQKIIDNIDSDNLLDVLKLQLDEAVKSENYEEAAELKNLIEKYKNMGNKG
jgi:hypothetical protein